MVVVAQLLVLLPVVVTDVEVVRVTCDESHSVMMLSRLVFRPFSVHATVLLDQLEVADSIIFVIIDRQLVNAELLLSVRAISAMQFVRAVFVRHDSDELVVFQDCALRSYCRVRSVADWQLMDDEHCRQCCC